MRFTTFALALLPLAFASPLPREEQNAAELVPRAGSAAGRIVNHLHKLKPEFAQLHSTLNTIPDDASSIPFTTLQTIENEVSAIEKALRGLHRRAKASGRFSSGQSKKVAAAMKADESTIFGTVSSLVAHKQAAQNSGVASSIQSGLVKLRHQFAAAAQSIHSKAVGKYAGEIASAAKTYKNHFDAAIKAYS